MPDAPYVPPSGPAGWLRARLAELEGANEVLAAQLAARDAQLEAAQARLAVLGQQIGELRPQPCRHPWGPLSGPPAATPG